MTTTPATRVAAPLGDPGAASDTPRRDTPADRGTGNAWDETPRAERGPDTSTEDTPGAPEDTQGSARAPAAAPVSGALAVVFVQRVRVDPFAPEPAAPATYCPPQLRGPSRRWAGRR